MALTEYPRRVVRKVRRLQLGSRRHLERFYAAEHDPFHIDSNPYELEKFEDMLEVMGDRRFTHALEVGCAIGSFTERLAPRCDALLAIDIAQLAVDRTKQRLQDVPDVTVERRTFPDQLPSGPFDLVVCSDVLYYLPERRLVPALQRLGEALGPGGSLISLHWMGEHGAPIAGERVHELQRSVWSSFTHVRSEHRLGVGPLAAGYRLERFDRLR